MRWLVSSNGQVAGPMDDTMVSTLVGAGKIAPDAFLREEHGAEWVRLSKTPFAAAIITVATAAPSPPTKVPTQKPDPGLVGLVMFGVGAAVLWAIWTFSLKPALNKPSAPEPIAVPVAGNEPLNNAEKVSQDEAQARRFGFAGRQLFASPTDATCTKADGDKILLAVDELRKDLTQCAQPRAFAPAPQCFALMASAHAHIDWIARQVDTLPSPTWPRESGDRIVDSIALAGDLRLCCCCDQAAARSSCPAARAALDAAPRKIKAWQKQIGKKNDEECVLSQMQMPMLKLGP